MEQTYSLEEAIEIGSTVQDVRLSLKKYEDQASDHNDTVKEFLKNLSKYEKICQKYPQLVQHVPAGFSKRINEAKSKLESYSSK